MAKQTIGEFLATLRKANGYTQQEVADRLGISNRTLSGWECNNVLPDILLLPALGELYGVTVDEILAGERKEKNNDVALSDMTARRVLKSKLARFSVQSWILLGIIFAGLTLAAICACIEAIKVSWDVFPWWRVLLVGIVPVVVCFAILLAYWKGAELFADDACEEYATYCLLLRKKLANCLFVISAVNVLATIAVAVALFSTAFSKDKVSGSGIVACIVFGVVAIALFVSGWLLYRHALVKFGGKAAYHSIQKDRQYFWSVAFWGLFPLVLSLVLVTVTAFDCLYLEENTTIYENSSIDEFIKYLETYEGLGKEYQFPLSELAKTAKAGDEFDLGDGFMAVYDGYTFTISNEQIVIFDGSDTEIKIVPFSMKIPRVLMIEEERTISFFNVRYWYYSGGPFRIDAISRNVYFDHYSFRRTDDSIAYIHIVTHDYSLVGYSVAFAVIAADVFVCAALCVGKRNKYAVKL